MELEIRNNALDISSNIWINANAGSGKTKILVDRFVKLIISECDVAKIICITYTKVATNEMRDRVYEILGKMHDMDDASLLDFLKKSYFHETCNVLSLRQKIEEILNDPNCLRISTIHSLCLDIIKSDILYQNYNIIDEKSDIYTSIKSNIVDKILDECEKNADLLDSIKLITDEMGMMSFDKVINDIIKNINHLNTTIYDKNLYITWLMELIGIEEIIPIKDIIDKLITKKKLSDEEKKAVRYELYNMGFTSNLLDFQYNNPIHIGILLDILVREKYNVLSPFYPLQKNPIKHKDVNTIMENLENATIDILNRTRTIPKTTSKTSSIRRIIKNIISNKS
jgi:superfamily I DNA/RNA helicase